MIRLNSLTEFSESEPAPSGFYKLQNGRPVYFQGEGKRVIKCGGPAKRVLENKRGRGGDHAGVFLPENENHAYVLQGISGNQPCERFGKEEKYLNIRKKL